MRLKMVLEEPRSRYLHRYARLIFLASSLALAKPGNASSVPLDELLWSWEGASRTGARQMSRFFSSSLPRTACIRVIYVSPDFSSCSLCGEPDGFSVCLGACLSTLFLLLTVVVVVVLFGKGGWGLGEEDSGEEEVSSCAEPVLPAGLPDPGQAIPTRAVLLNAKHRDRECVNGSGTKQVGDVWSISAGAGDPDFNHLLTGKNLPPSYLGGIRLLPPVRGN